MHNSNLPCCNTLSLQELAIPRSHCFLRFCYCPIFSVLWQSSTPYIRTHHHDPAIFSVLWQSSTPYIRTHHHDPAIFSVLWQSSTPYIRTHHHDPAIFSVLWQSSTPYIRTHHHDPAIFSVLWQSSTPYIRTHHHDPAIFSVLGHTIFAVVPESANFSGFATVMDAIFPRTTLITVSWGHFSAKFPQYPLTSLTSSAIFTVFTCNFFPGDFNDFPASSWGGGGRLLSNVSTFLKVSRVAIS